MAEFGRQFESTAESVENIKRVEPKPLPTDYKPTVKDLDFVPKDLSSVREGLERADRLSVNALGRESDSRNIGDSETAELVSPEEVSTKKSPIPAEIQPSKKKLGKLAVMAGTTVLGGAAIVAGFLGIKSKENESESNDDTNPGGAPTLIVPTAQAEEPTPIEVVEKVEPIKIEREVFEYFKEIALQFEGGAKINVTKWMEDPKIKVRGNPTEEDMVKLREVIGELNSMQPQITISIVEEVSEEGNVDLYFESYKKFQEINPMVPSGATAYFFFDSVPYDESKPLFSRKISKAEVFIATERPQHTSNIAILQEVTQILGLPNDSDKYPDTVFRQSHPGVEYYSEIDRKIIAFLYNAQVKPGMNEKDLLKIVKFID